MDANSCYERIIGWYVFGGQEASIDPDFYSALCTTHLRKYCEIAIPYLFLPLDGDFRLTLTAMRTFGMMELW